MSETTTGLWRLQLVVLQRKDIDIVTDIVTVYQFTFMQCIKTDNDNAVLLDYLS